MVPCYNFEWFSTRVNTHTKEAIFMENMPLLLLFVITMAANLTGSLVRSYYSKRVSQSTTGHHLLNALSSLVCGLTLIALSGGNFQMSPFTLGMAVLFGMVSAGLQVATSAALSLGPWSYTSVITSMSTVLTALSGMLFFGESLRVTQIFGIVMMVGCLILSVKKGDDQKKKSLRWFMLSLVSCACSGGIGLMQKLHQKSAFRSELTMFLIVAFICSFLFSSANLLVAKYSKKSKFQPFFDKKPAIWLLAVLFVACGIGIALNNLINLYLSGVVDSAIFFPIVNGGGLILITIASLVVFKEKLTGRQWTGLTLGIAATLLLCI